MASTMSDANEMLDEAFENIAEVRSLIDALRAENGQLTFENGALRERLRLSEEERPAVPYSDDELDAVRDRERDEEFERSTDRYDRGARD